MLKYSTLFALVIILSACSSGEDKGKLLAKVFESELYQSDLNYLFRNKDYAKEDSVAIAQSFVDEWVKSEILVHEASMNDKIDIGSIEKKTEGIKNDLIVMELEQVLVDEQLDTAVSKEEVQKYYDSHLQDFELNDYLVKVLYLKVPGDAPNIDKIGSHYKLYNEKDINEIDKYAQLYASNYYYDEENWIYFDDLLKEIPLQDINKDRFIMKRSKIRFEENGNYYFLNIIDYKLKNTTSPISFERGNIKERIIHTRVMELREQIKNEIISKAYDENAVTTF
ncbi:MAG: hypothetical protein ACI857_000025 [Arenicella sp.]|jgi:hypothetical protein